jgi:hypothetical protein
VRDYFARRLAYRTQHHSGAADLKPCWKSLVITDVGIDRRFYEICALAELKNSLRSGDIWVQGSRQFKDFDEYLLPADTSGALKQTSELPLAVPPIVISTCTTGCRC